METTTTVDDTDAFRDEASRLLKTAEAAEAAATAAEANVYRVKSGYLRIEAASNAAARRADAQEARRASDAAQWELNHPQFDEVIEVDLDGVASFALRPRPRRTRTS